jgi:hypothetical protein
VLRSSKLTLQPCEEIGLPVVEEFLCVKNFISCMELWVDEDVEMIAIKVEGMDPKYSCEIIVTYRAASEDMLVIEGLVTNTQLTRDAAK